MANRFPLIANSSSNQIQELANADNLDLTGNNIVGLSNIAVTGIATATTFSGALSGNATSATSATTATTATNAQGLTGTPDITVRNIIGVGATLSGTLTYEDVTNIDSVGIVTARTGVKVLAGGVDAVGIVTGTAVAGYDYLRAPFSTTVNFAVTVASKTAAHRYNGTGSSSGYVIDGVQSPFLTLTPGRTYRFTLSSSDMSSHPFRFYLEADKTTAYTTNVTSTATYTEITVTDSTPQVLHYQCSAHGYMGNAVNTNSNAASSAFTGTVSDSIGPLRRLGTSNVGSNRALATSDTGKFLRINAGGVALSVPSGTFTAGDMISFFNVSTADMTVTSSAVTVYNSADGDTGNTRTIAAKGMATLLCTANNEFVISGTQLT